MFYCHILHVRENLRLLMSLCATERLHNLNNRLTQHSDRVKDSLAQAAPQMDP